MPQLTQLDMIALAVTLALWLGAGWLIEHPPKRWPSVTLLMQGYRHAWMQEFVTRNPRVFDGTIIDSLRQGTAFFASAAMIAASKASLRRTSLSIGICQKGTISALRRRI